MRVCPPWVPAGLVELNLSHNKLRELPALPTAPHLRAINVAGNQELDLPAATLRALPAQAPALRELRVGATKSIAAVVELARAMPGLKIT